ncbi:MAG: hypothetical protein R3A49_13340 [Acidimicrobiia bacterium]
MRGRWAQGLEPRMFCWVVQDRMAISERPGGYGRSHRKVRREEELIWLKREGFTRVLSLLDTPHNLSAYEEAEIEYARVPLGEPDDESERLVPVYESIARLLDVPDSRILVHHEDLGDRVLGAVAGYLLYTGAVDTGPHAVAIVEKLTGRELGAAGRRVVAVTLDEEMKRVV